MKKPINFSKFRYILNKTGIPSIMRRGNREWILKCYIVVTLLSTLLVVYNDPSIVSSEGDNTAALPADQYNLTFTPARTLDSGILVIDEEERHQRHLDRSYHGCRRRLPHALIIGAAKCGTEAMQFFLQLHPDIATDIQELNFFAQDVLYNRGYDWYRRQMPISYLRQITVQRGTWYWDTLGVPERIQAMNSSMKILLLACEPSRRVVSWYMHKMRHMLKNTEAESFDNQFFFNGRILSNQRALRSGRYKVLLKRWLFHFNMSQVLIVDGEAMRENPFPELQKVETFLGIGHKISNSSLAFSSVKGFWCKSQPHNAIKKFDCLPGGKGRKHDEVNQTTLKKKKVPTATLR